MSRFTSGKTIQSSSQSWNVTPLLKVPACPLIIVRNSTWSSVTTSLNGRYPARVQRKVKFKIDFICRRSGPFITAAYQL